MQELGQLFSGFIFIINILNIFTYIARYMYCTISHSLQDTVIYVHYITRDSQFTT